MQGSKMGVGTAATIAGARVPFSVPSSTLLGAGGGYAASGNTIEETVGGTALGGITGAAFGLAGKGLSKYSANKAAKSGNIKMTASSLKPSPFMADSIDDLQGVANSIGVKSTMVPEDKVRVIGGAFKNADKQIDDLLAIAPPLDQNSLVDDFARLLDETGFDDASPSQRRFLNTLLSRAEKTGGSPVALNKLKSELRGELTRAFKSPNPSPTDQAKMALWSSIKNSLDNVSPQIRQLNSFQNKLYNLAEELGLALKKDTAAQIKVPLTNVGVNLPASRGELGALGSRVSSGAAGGKTSGAIGSLLTRPALAAVGGYAAGRGGEYQPELGQRLPIEPMMGVSSNGGAGNGIQVKTSNDFYSGNATKKDWIVTPDGKRIWNPNTQKYMAYDSEAFGGGGAEAGTPQAILPKLDDLLARHQSLSGTGPVLGRISQVGRAFGGVPDLAGYESFASSLAVSLAAAMGLKPLSEEEVAEVREMWLPSPRDTDEQARAKIAALKQLLGNTSFAPRLAQEEIGY